MKAIIALAVVFVTGTFAAQNGSSADDFNSWKERYAKSYSKNDGKNETVAQQNFKKNVAAINKHNSDPEATYKQKVNSHADMTKEEFEKTRCGYKPSPELSKKVKSSSKSESEKAFEEELNKLNQTNKRVKGPGDPTSLDYSR
jgi:Cathepsin propeptide inhibitor domain (I29)